jgi:hypothetical protein
MRVGIPGAEDETGGGFGRGEAVVLFERGTRPPSFMESSSLAAAADRCRLEEGFWEVSSLEAQRAWAMENWRKEAAMPSLRRESSGLPRPMPVCIECRIIEADRGSFLLDWTPEPLGAANWEIS